MNKTLALTCIFIFLVLAANAIAESTHTQVEIGKPVRWEKTIDHEKVTTKEVAVKVSDIAENIKVITEDYQPVKASVKNPGAFRNMVTGLATITGFAAKENLETKEIQFNKTEDKNYKVVYETQAPKIDIRTQRSEKAVRKDIAISSDIHYTDILSYVDVPELEKESIRLYHKQGGLLFNERIEITNNPDYKVEFMDRNDNGLIDRVKWVTPHLSTQEFELEGNLTVLDVQSYPLVEGNWTTRFLTNGTDDLTIEAVNGTEYGTDLTPLSITCKEEEIPFQLSGNTITIHNYSCNETAYHTVQVHTTGKHYQLFSFKGESKLAKNDAQNAVMAFFSDSGYSDTITENNPASIGDPVYIRFSWEGGEDQAIIAKRQGSSGTCTFTESSGCFAHSSSGPSPREVTSNELDASFDTFTNTIEATLRNNTDDEVTLTDTLYVNHPPSVTTSFDPSTPTSADDIDCVIDINDIDHTSETYTIDVEWRVNGASYTNATRTGITSSQHIETLPASATSPGEDWSCRAEVTDMGEETDYDSVSSTIQSAVLNIDPAIDSMERLTEETFQAIGTTSTTFTWSITNLEGPADGLEIISASDQQEVTVRANDNGLYTLQVEDGNNDLAEMNITINDTLPPEAVNTMEAHDVRNDQGGHIEINWDPSSSDDVYGYYILRSESESGGSNVTPRNISSPGFIRHSDSDYSYIDNTTDHIDYTYWVYACDDLGNCVSSTVSRQARSNAQPRILEDELVIDPEKPTAKDNVSIIVFASDINNESLDMFYNCSVTQFDPGGANYNEHGQAWCFYLGANSTSQYGTQFDNATTECIISIDSERLTKADKLSCTFRAYDRMENSTTASTDSFIPIHNTPPKASDVTILPQDPNQSSELYCNYSYYDFDNDPEDPAQTTFRWYINNEGLNEFVEVKGYTDQTISNIFDKDDEVKCAVKVHDDDQSWMNEDNFSTQFYESEPVTIVDNAVPQIIDYGNTYSSPDNPAFIGDFINFTVSWRDYEDPDDTARMYVCNDYLNEDNLYDKGTDLISFGDTEENRKRPAIFYSNMTGQYVHKIGIYPEKFIGNSKTTFAVGSEVRETDFDNGTELYDFEEVYFDADLSDTYTIGETIILENTSSAALEAGAEELVYDADFDTIVSGEKIPDKSPLTSFSSKNVFRHTDVNFTEDSDIYWDKDEDSFVSAGDLRLNIISESQDSASTEFIYDIIVMEVDSIGDTQGTVIARDNDNAFELGRYNYFTPQYNAQPMPGKYLAFKICIDDDNDDTCESNGDFLEDKVFVQANATDQHPIIRNDTHNYSHPRIRMYYGGDINGACEGITYCNTSNSSDNDQQCTYQTQEDDGWENIFQVKVCDEHDACSIYREGSFFLNHPPEASTQILTTEGTTNFTSDSNLNCTYLINDTDNHNMSRLDFTWHLKRDSAGFRQVNLPNSPIVTNGNTMPGDVWKCSVTPYDPFQKGDTNTSEPVTIEGLPSQFKIEDVQDNSDYERISEGQDVEFFIDWHSEYATAVKAYVCDSPEIVGSGCMGRTIAESSFTLTDPINLQHTVDDLDNTTQEYWVMICDEGWNCSNIYPSVTNDSIDYLTNHRPTVNETEIRQISYSADGKARCIYNFIDSDNDEEGPNTTFRWYTADQDNYTLIPGAESQDLTDPFSYGDRISCAVKVSDEEGLMDDEFRMADNILKEDGIPPAPKIWNPPVSVTDNTGFNITGFFSVPDVNYSIHARQGYDISPESGDITGFTSVNSTYYGSVYPMDESDQDYIIVPAASIEQDDIIETGRYIQFSNQNLTNFSRYRVDSYRNLYDDTYKVTLDPALKSPVNRSTEMFVYDNEYPSGHFTVTLPELFNGTNLIRIRGKNDQGNGPFTEFYIHVDRGTPFINTSSVPSLAMSTEPMVYFTVHDDYHINTQSITINATNSTNSTLYTGLNCSGNRTLQYCKARLSLVMNSTYNLTFSANDSAGWPNSSTITNFSVTPDQETVENIENGFIGEDSVLHLPATIATNPILVANWSLQSGIIKHYEYMVEEYDGNTYLGNMTGWLSTTDSNHTFVNVTLELKNDMVYKFRVRPRYIDESLGPETLSSGIVYFVNKAPVKEFIRFKGKWNGTANASALFTSSPSRLKLHWNFSNVAQITQYRYAVGTAPYPEEGYDSIASNNDYSLTELELTDLSLEDGTQYYASVRAKNENNIWSNWYSSEYPITTDLSAPYGGSIDYPTGLRASNFTVTLTKGYDDISGIKERELQRATGTLQDGECSDLNIFYPVDTELAGSYTQTVNNGKCYTFRYVEKDYVNNTKTYLHGGTAAFTYIDQTPPEGFTVTANNGEFITTNNQLAVDWTPSHDPEMGISHYSYALFRDENQLGSWTKITAWNSTSTHALITIDDPKHQSAYKVKVSAYSNGNLTNPTTEQSNSVVYLDTVEPEQVSIVKVENDTTEPYVDTIPDNQTDILVSGEEGMRCVASRYKIDYEDYDPSKNYLENCSETTGNNLTCFINTTEDALYTRYIVCRDEAGNKQFSDLAKEVTWHVDFNPPQIDILSNDTLIGGVIRFDVEIEDPSPVIERSYTIYNSTGIITSGNFNNSIEWDTTHLYKENVTLRIEATDSFNHTATAERNYTVDNSKPAISFRRPDSNDKFFKEGFFMNVTITNKFYSTGWEIEGKLNDSLNSSTLLDHHTWDSYINTTEWEDGKYTLTVDAIGPYETNEKSADFYIDNVAPRYSELINPEAPVYNDNSVTLTAVWNNTFNSFANSCDLDSVIISHNASGTWVNVTPEIEGDRFIYEIPQSLLNNGERIGWQSHARDFSGNTNSTGIMTFVIRNREMTFYNEIPDLTWPANINLTIDMMDHINDPDNDTLQYNVTYLPSGTIIYDNFDHERDNHINPHYSEGLTNKGILLESATTNLLKNPDFESVSDDLVQWHAHNEPSVNTSSDNSVRVNRNNYYTQVVEINPDKEYTFSAYIRSVTGEAFGRLHLEWLDESMGFIETGLICGAGTNCSVTPLVNESFTRESATLKSPSNARYARVYLDSHNESYVLMDNVQLEEKPYPTSYTSDARNVTFAEYDAEAENYTINLWFDGIEDKPLITLMNQTDVYTYSPGNMTGWNMVTIRHDTETDIFINGTFNKTIPGMSLTEIVLGYSQESAETVVDDFAVLNRSVSNATILSWTSGFITSPLMNDSITGDLITFSVDNNITTDTSAIIDVTDGIEHATTNPFLLTTVEPNRMPELTPIPDFSLLETENLSYQINATEPDNEPINYTVSNPDIAINETGFMFWNITGWDVGEYTETITVCDNRSVLNSCATDSFNITISMVDVDSDGIPDTIDPLLGKPDNMNVSVGGDTNLSQRFTGVQTVRFFDDRTRATIEWNFSKQLDLTNMTINASLWYNKITGLDLQGETKEVYLLADSAIKTVCIKDNENFTMSGNCNGTDEYLLYCNQTNDPLYTNGYDCTEESGYFIISGLHSSYAMTSEGCMDPDGDGYGYGTLCPSDCNEGDPQKYQYYPYYNDSDLDGYTLPYSNIRCGNGSDMNSGIFRINRTAEPDCNDHNADIHPGAEEICGNGIDENCDGTDAACSTGSSGSGSSGSSSSSGGGLPPCTENWVCSEWTTCTQGEKTRTCSDQNECGTVDDKPETSMTCETCDDGIQNQGEEGVDCGGPCEPCQQSTCDDGIQNQGEEGVDCGGPCEPCQQPTCDDGIQNQGEEGVDCGGPCAKCPEEQEPGLIRWFVISGFIVGILGIIGGLYLSLEQPRQRDYTLLRRPEAKVIAQINKGVPANKLYANEKIDNNTIKSLIMLNTYTRQMRGKYSDEEIKEQFRKNNWPEDLVELTLLVQEIMPIMDRPDAPQEVKELREQLIERRQSLDKETMHVLFDLYRNTPPEQIKGDPQLIQRLSVLKQRIEELKRHNLRNSDIVEKLAQEGWPREQAEFESQILEILLYALDERKNKSYAQIRQELQRHYPPEVINFILNNIPQRNRIPANDHEVVAILDALRKGIPVKDIRRMIQQSRWSQNIVDNVIELDNMIRATKEKGYSKEQIKQYFTAKGWQPDRVDKLLEYF
ncbi:MAG: MopE-related protein [Candidatus Woesearchaeota archaeon]